MKKALENFNGPTGGKAPANERLKKTRKSAKGRAKKNRMEFKGDVVQDDLVIGSHGDTTIRIKGNFQLSGIVYCPRYTITLDIKGDGTISFRGKCHRIIIKRMQGDCTLDLNDVTYRELHCQSLKGKSKVMAGNARAITPAILDDDAVLQVNERQLIFNPVTSGNSRILTTTSAGVEELFIP